MSHPALLRAVTVATLDLAASRTFYDAVLGALGWVRAAELVDEEEGDAEVEALAWGPVDAAPQLWLVRATAATTGLHLQLSARSRQEVETFSHLAEQHGGSLVASPRRWTVYRRGEFGATVADPCGNRLEAIAPE